MSTAFLAACVLILAAATVAATVDGAHHPALVFAYAAGYATHLTQESR